MILFEKKYQTFDTVFHHQMKHLEVRQKYSAARRIFNSLLGVSSGDETLHLMFDILLEKWFWKVFVICLISQWLKRSKHGLFVFPPKKTLIWRRHCLIGQSCCSMKSKWSIDWFLESSSDEKFFQPSVHLTNQKPCTFVSIRQTYQIALFLFILCFFFCTVHWYIFDAVLTLVTV